MAVLLCTCALIADDQPANPPTFAVHVNMISIDLEILDENGDPVLGP